jgi:hypothetical protein
VTAALHAVDSRSALAWRPVQNEETWYAETATQARKPLPGKDIPNWPGGNIMKCKTLIFLGAEGMAGVSAAALLAFHQ